LLKRGAAYGILTWNGVPEAAERRLTSTSKRDWFFAPSNPVLIQMPKSSTATTATSTTTTTTTTNAAAATARQ
jgi:hypothetical protein